MLLEFVDYLRQLSLEDNTIRKIQKRFNAVLNEATRLKINDVLDYQHSDVLVSPVKQEKIYLNKDELDQVQQVNLPFKERLDKVRDWLLLGVNTGLRISDLKRLNKDHIVDSSEGKILKVLLRKSKNMVSISVNSIVDSIVCKYDGFPPRISDQRFNEYVKELCRMAGINKRVSKIEKGEQVFYEKWQLVSSHICRRSFATNAFKAGLHPKYLMPITGHITVKQFMEYICIDDEENLLIVSKHAFFK